MIFQFKCPITNPDLFAAPLKFQKSAVTSLNLFSSPCNKVYLMNSGTQTFFKAGTLVPCSKKASWHEV